MFIINFIASIIIIALFATNFLRLKSNMKKIGAPYFKWQSKLDMSTCRGKYNIFAIVLSFLLIIHWLIFHREENDGYAFIITFLLVYSFYPKWMIIFGENGIVFDNKFVAWDEIKKCRFMESDGKLKISHGPLYSEDILKIKPQFNKECRNLLEKVIPEKVE